MMRRLLGLFGLLVASGPLWGQEVTLPLAQYEDLRERARPTPEPKVPPPAELALAGVLPPSRVTVELEVKAPKK